MTHEQAFSLVSEICPQAAGLLWNTTDRVACDTAWAVAEQYSEEEIESAASDLRLLATGTIPVGWERV